MGGNMAEQGSAVKPVAPVAPVVVNAVKTDVKVQVQKIVSEVKPIIGNQPPKPKGPVVKEKSWMYHKDLPPILLEKDQEIPDGFIPENKWRWYKDMNNNFIWRK